MLGSLAILLAFSQVALASTFDLNVQISDNQLKSMKDLGYNLCIAKKVNNNYTVVWSGNQAYLANNVFEWEESYQVYGSNNFSSGALVNAATNIVGIDFNQTSILTKEGVMEDATGTIAPGPFFVANEFGLISIGVNGLLGSTYLPIYVSPTIVEATNTLQPITTVMAWFALNQTTSTMIFKSETAGIEVVYEGTTNMTISYSGPDGQGTWSFGPLPPSSTTLPKSTRPPSKSTMAPSKPTKAAPKSIAAL